jgi:hypothetical protein
MFGSRKPPAPPSRAALEQKVDSLRPGSPAPPASLDQGEVTGVIDLALERLEIAQHHTVSAVQAASQRLLDEAQRTRDLARSLTVPPQDT